MTDLFHPPATIEAHGRIYDLRPLGDEPVNETTFAKFWQDVPHKNNKKNAEKAWQKLNSAERAQAHKMVGAFYAQFRKDYPTASPLHVSTYLNGRRWEDEGLTVAKTATPDDPLAPAERAIKSRKRFLCTHVTEHQARQLLAAGRVTEQECREMGVL